MVSEKITVTSALGIHLRPAGTLSDNAGKFESKVYLKHEKGKTVNAKSMIAVLSLGAECGDEVELIVEGTDEQEALKTVSQALKKSLEDDD